MSEEDTLSQLADLGIGFGAVPSREVPEGRGRIIRVDPEVYGLIQDAAANGWPKKMSINKTLRLLLGLDHDDD